MRSGSLVVLFTLPMLMTAALVEAAKPAPAPAAKAAPPASAPAKPTAAPKPAAPQGGGIDLDALEFQAVQLQSPADSTAVLPYSIDIPQGWEMGPWSGGAFLVLGPRGQAPPSAGAPQNPWVIALHPSPNKFPGADAAVAALQAAAAKASTWKLVSVVAHDFGGTQGMLALTESGADALRARTYTVRLPLGDGTLDVIASAPEKDFPTFQALYERILFSLQRTSKE